MSLSDVMSHAGFSRYAEVALILFFVAFVAIVAAIFRPSRRDRLEANRTLPLEDDRPRIPGSGGAV